MDQVLKNVYAFITFMLPMVLLLIFIMAHAAYFTYAERKVLAHMQNRLGPMRTGWHGLLQPIADGVKSLMKEDIIPAKADVWLFKISPLILFTTAIAAYAAVPFGPRYDLYGFLGKKVPLGLSDLSIGVLYILALANLGTYGVVMGGWSSNNKYSLMGGLRSAAQLISYEIPMAFSVITVVLITGSLNLTDIVTAQSEVWLIAALPIGPVLFLLYFISGIAETARTPFDLPEAESELVAGFYTEYSGVRYVLLFLSEYINMLMISLLAALMFLGGWMPLQIFPRWASGGIIEAINAVLRDIPPFLWLLAKGYAFIFVFIWIRGTLPRFRYDQLMSLGWKVMVPLSIVTLFCAAFMKQFGLL